MNLISKATSSPEDILAEEVADEVGVTIAQAAARPGLNSTMYASMNSSSHSVAGGGFYVPGAEGTAASME